jgi:hypothetical protein
VFRHAVQTAQIAAVGERQAQLALAATARIDELAGGGHRLAGSLGSGRTDD